MQETIDELLEWLHTFDDLQFSCNHRNVIEKIWQIKSKQQFAIPAVVGQSEQLKDFLQEVADWDKDYSSTLIKLKAKELLKGF